MTNDALKKLRYGISFLMKRMVHVNLQLSYECNFRCSICDFWKTRYDEAPVLSLPQARHIARELKAIGPQIISIGGGEPLMHPDIIPITACLARDNFAVMISNGWFVTRENAKALFSTGIYEISVSLDYADPQKHDAQRGKEGAYERAVNALRILNESRMYPHQRVHMISVVMNDNIDDIEPLILLSRKLGITYLVTLYSDCRGEKAIRSSDRDISRHLLYLKNRYPEFVALRGYLSRFTEAARNNGISPCFAGKNLCNIDSSGNVTFCIDHLDRPAGNILSQDMLSIMRTLEKQRNDNTCTDCWTSCRGSIESAMYGRDRILNLFDYYQMTKSLPVHYGVSANIGH